jgi:hypothetical protein
MPFTPHMCGVDSGVDDPRPGLTYRDDNYPPHHKLDHVWQVLFVLCGSGLM